MVMVRIEMLELVMFKLRDIVLVSLVGVEGDISFRCPDEATGHAAATSQASITANCVHNTKTLIELCQ